MSLSLSYPYGAATVSGLIKQQPEDFQVFENLGFSPSGEGEHLFLQVEKCAITTQELIEQVAQDFALKARDIGYSGLKDKRALTRQWLSVQLPGSMNSLQLPSPNGYKILEHHWHHKKLRPGTHKSNRFEVLVRNLSTPSASTQAQIDQIATYGMANFFGEQRFGRQQDNLEQALRAFGNARRARKLSRNKKSLYLSSLRSHLFNQVLSRRIAAGYWSQPMEGDVFMLEGSHSIFYQALDPTILDRYKRLDLASSVSMFGEGERQLQGQALAFEDAVLAENAPITECLLAQGAKLQMRATRIPVQDFVVKHDAAQNTYQISATLPSGCYFTTLLAHFIDFDTAS